MKIRHGFVSNSSSTSFTFVFKGDEVKNLSDTILKYKKHFDLSHTCDNYLSGAADIYICNAQDVAEAIERCIETTKDDKWDVVKIVSIEDHIKELKIRIKELDVYIKEQDERKKNHPGWYNNYLHEDKVCIQEEIEKLQAAIKNGLTSVLVIGFGDNDGAISGQGLGCTMDYEGRMIDIDEKDFIVLTEQAR